MEFLSPTLFNTSTQIVVNSNTATAANLYNRDPVYQYYSDGFADDNTSTTITITFDATTSVSRIAMLGMNFKEFSVFYNGATANTFAITGGDTSASSYTGNADSDKYFRFSTIACTSITINAKKTMTANQEKVISLFVPTDLIFALALIPDAKGYKPKLTPKQVVHKLSDGGTRLHNIRKKWSVDLNLEYVSQTQRDSLYDDIFDSGDEFNFCPFGTTTSWDGIFFEAVWDGAFQFYEYSDNAVAAGFSGKITLKETPY
jgi:hypothetical protein